MQFDFRCKASVEQGYTIDFALPRVPPGTGKSIEDTISWSALVFRPLVNDVRVHVFAFRSLRGNQRSSDFTSKLYLVISVVARRWKCRGSTAMADRTS